MQHKWEIPSDISEITEEYISEHMPSETTSIQFPEDANIGISVFQNYTQLTSLVFRRGVKINECAFMGCTSIKDIVVHDNVKIYDDVFLNCTQLSLIHFGKNVYCYHSFFNCANVKKIVIPEHSEITAFAFNGCGVPTLKIPRFTKIHEHAFHFCVKLRSLVINSNTEVHIDAFSHCISLRFLNIHKNGIIHEDAFSSCIHLTFLALDENVDIHENGFEDCTNIRFIVIPKVFSRDHLPAASHVITYEELEAFCLVNDLKGLRQVQEKLVIYKLFEDHQIDRVEFEALSNLSVSTMFNIISKFHEKTNQDTLSKQLLAWTVEKHVKTFLGIKDSLVTCCLSRSPSILFQSSTNFPVNRQNTQISKKLRPSL